MKKQKTSLSFIITTLVVGLVTLFLLWSTFYFFSLYVGSMKQAAHTSSEQAVTQASNTISNYIGDMQEIMSLIEKDLTKSGGSTGQTLETLCSVRSDLVAVYIYDEQGKLVDSHTGTHTLKEHYLKDLSYIELDSYSPGVLYLSEPHVESLLQDYYPWVVSVLQEIPGADGQKLRVVIDIRFSKISDYVDDVGIGQHGYCFITDSNGEIIYHPQQQLLYSGLKTEATEGLDLSHNGSFETEELICSVLALDNCNWKVVGVSYISELVTAKEMELVGNICVMLTIILLTTMVVSVLVSRLVTNPVQRLIRAMEEFEKDAAGYVYQPVEGTTEIEALSQSYEHMVRKIQKLMKQVRQEEISLRKTELKALQAQINPHFLFNTLNAGAQLAMMEGADRTYEYVQNVAEFFRYNVKKSNDIVTVREELELVDHYIYILNVRFSGDIHYGKEIEEDLLDSCMPSMILQPIVENSVNHGIREMNGEGKIRLKVYHVDGDTLGISIRDNGIGMDRDTIEKVLGGNYHEEQSGGGSNGIAMGNIIARLKLFTQNEDVMTILSDGKNQGTEVILYLPIKEREKTDV